MKSSSRFWLVVFLIWMFSTVSDRIWWNHFDGLPSWDQADYLNSALDHGRALGLLPSGQWNGFNSVLDLSPKIPPLASVFNGLVIALVGDAPYKAAWSLSLWHGLLILGVASWARELSGKGVALLSVAFVSLAPALIDLRLDYVLEMPLTALVTLSLWRLGCWWSPQKGGKWIQSLTAACLCLGAILVKQSALLVLLPALAWVSWTACRRGNFFRIQLLTGVSIICSGLYPWLHHNWITTLGGTNRAVLESAAREGDPSVWTLENWLWYPNILPGQIGLVVLIVGLSGGILLFSMARKRAGFFVNGAFLDDLYGWKWLLITLFFGWVFTSISPNKGDRYITPLLPMLLILLSRGWWQWILFIRSNSLFARTKQSIPLFLLASFVSILPSAWEANLRRFNSRYQGPLEEIVLAAGGADPLGMKTTVIVVPSTPDLNQHNMTYFGRRNGGHLVGRQLGNSKNDIEPLLNYADMVVLAEGDQGSIRESALMLDQAVRNSGVFFEMRRFQRLGDSSYSLWKRRKSQPKGIRFSQKFPELANGLAKGPPGLQKVFSQIEVEHMLDGHFIYREEVREKASELLSQNPNDVQALWTLGLLEALGNRPAQAAKHFSSLEAILPDSPWPSVYLSVVTLADWNPWGAARVADRANRRHSNTLLRGLGDLSSILGGALWRLPSATNTIPEAVMEVENAINANN